MTHYPQCNPTHRATRIQLQTTPAVVKLGDGKQTKGEEKLLKDLSEHLGISPADAKRIAAEARSRAEKLASKV